MNFFPLVSICIPTYNGEKYLKECLESVITQTYSNIEIIIVDDCSNDTTLTIINDYIKIDKRIQLYRNESNLGLVGNWNKCLELAQGEWIKFVFQDDLIAKECIQKKLAVVENNSFIVCDRHFIFDDFVPDEIKAYYNDKLLSLKSSMNTNRACFFTSEKISEIAVSNMALNFIGEPTAVMFRKSIIPQIGVFNVDFSQICDLEYWLRIATSSGLIYIPEELVSFRIHSSSETSKNVISSNKFIPRYIDAVLLAYEMLHSIAFEKFRKSIDFSKKKKIEIFIISKINEAKIKFKKAKNVDPLFFEKLFLKYPMLKSYIKPLLVAKIIYWLVILKRKLKRF